MDTRRSRVTYFVQNRSCPSCILRDFVMNAGRYKYLLGDARRERARLRHQASIWDPKALALFDRLKIRRGWRVLEIGPGQGSLHKELRRRVRGPVDVVEPSATFADGIRRLWRRDGRGDG